MLSDNIVYIAPTSRTDTIVDLYCGGGGSGQGILDACARLGRNPSGTFVNHWDKAIDIHTANHPEHRHLKEDLFLLDPKGVFPPGTATSLLWASPSCVQFSISRGNRPINEQGRSHADTVVQWVEHLRPEGMLVENVKEFLQWGPLRQKRNKKTGELQWALEIERKKGKQVTTSIKPVATLPPEHLRSPAETEPEWELRMIGAGYHRHLEPDPAHKGEYFRAWFATIVALGYTGEWKIIRSADHGDPTIRQRLFVQFARDDSGKRVCWPDQRFLKPGAKRPEFKTRRDRPLRSWPTARQNVIDWSIKGVSVFSHERKRALVKATMRRLAIGLVKFGLKDFILPQQNFGGDKVRSEDSPVSAVTTNHRGEGLATPLVTPFALTSNKCFGDGTRGLNQPTVTLTTHGRGEGLAEGRASWLIPNFGERDDQTPRTHDLDSPIPAVTSHGAGGLCSAEFLLTKQGLNPHMNEPRDLDAPAPTAITDGRIHLCNLQSFILPKDQGHLGDYVTSIEQPCCTVQTTSVDQLVQPCLIQLNKCSNAISPDEPVTALTGMNKHGLMQPEVVSLGVFTVQQRGTGAASSVDQPTHALTAGGCHELVADAFLLAINQSLGSKFSDPSYSPDQPVHTVPTKSNAAVVTSFMLSIDNCGKDGAIHNTYATTEPLHTIPTKANASLIEMSTEKVPGRESGVKFTLQTLEECVKAVAAPGVDTSRVIALLEPLMEELRKVGRVDIKPWVYVYYGSGAVGADINTPMPTVRTKEGTAVCYPVLEFDGEFLLLDILYRMLTVEELQRAQGFPSWRWCATGSACLKRSPTSLKSAAMATAARSSSPKLTGGDLEKLAGVHARINCGLSVLEIRSVVKSSGSAKVVEKLTSYPLPTEHVDSVRKLAGILKTQGKGIIDGLAATIGRSLIDSTSPPSGALCESRSLIVTDAADDAGTRIQLTLEKGDGWSTTSGDGKHSQHIDSILTTLCSYVAGVMASCIPEKTWTDSSFAWTLELDNSFIWPVGVTKTETVKAIGNSVSRGLAEALALAWYSQNEDIEHFYNN